MGYAVDMTRRDVATQSLVKTLIELGLTTKVVGDTVVVEDGQSPLIITTDPSKIGPNSILARPRISDSLKRRFESEGAGWLDSSQLKVRSSGLFIDTEVSVIGRRSRADRSLRVLAGPAVSAVTLHALESWPEPMMGVRALAHVAEVSPGGVSLASNRLIEAGLLTADRRATAALFWVAATEWRPQWEEAVLPREIPWTEVGVQVAASLGAPVAVGPASERRVLIREETLPIMTSSHVVEDKVLIAVAPSPVVVHDDQIASTALVALTLATDPGRGTEIVENWDGDHVWH